MRASDSFVLRIEAGTRVPRPEMIARISAAIQAANGFVMDWKTVQGFQTIQPSCLNG
jgi:hypothetical protein